LAVAVQGLVQIQLEIMGQILYLALSLQLAAAVVVVQTDHPTATEKVAVLAGEALLMVVIIQGVQEILLQ
jgi:hypothetical protein